MGVLRKWFGPNRKQIWQALAHEIGADYQPGTFWKGGRIEARHGEWILTLDTYTVSTGHSAVTYTRMRAPYVNPDLFRFTIYRRGLFTGLGQWLGLQDIEVGHPGFDHDFVIKGTDEGKLRALFANERLRQLIAAQPRVHLTVKDHEGWFGKAFPPDTDELCFHVVGVITDPERLKQLFELFAETLDQLCRIGSAYEQAPDVKL